MPANPRRKPHPPGATLHLGGHAWASPDLEPLLVPIDQAIPYPGNPRRHDQDNITGSIRDLGLWAGVVTQTSTGHTLVGNGRTTALLELGATRIPRTRMDVDDTRAAAIVARDNQTSDASTLDPVELLALLTADEDVLTLSGYVDEDLEALRRAIANEEFALGAAAPGTPLSELSDPVDTDGEGERVTVTVDKGTRAQLYALLVDVPFVRDVADAHTRKPA